MTKRVLFLCTGNSARSQMAEAFLRHYAADEFEAHSAGLEPKGIHPLTVQVMREIGLDLSGQYSKSVTEYLGKMHFGYLVTLCSDAEERCPSVFPSVGQRIHWAFEDPAAFAGSAEARLDKFRQVRDQIDSQIRAWLEAQGLRYHRGSPRRWLEEAVQNEDVAQLLDDLQDKVLALGDQVESILIRSADLLQRPDPEGLERLEEEGRRARQMRLAIEMRCLALIAAQKCRDGSERSPAVMIEIAYDLELISEHARQIGRADYVVLDRCFGDSLKSIHHLVEVVRSMLRQATWATALRDEAVAQAVLARAAATEPLYERVQQELRALVKHRLRFVNQTIHLAHSVNQLGQVTEKIVSICSWIVFEIQGGTHVASNV